MNDNNNDQENKVKLLEIIEKLIKDFGDIFAKEAKNYTLVNADGEGVIEDYKLIDDSEDYFIDFYFLYKERVANGLVALCEMENILKGESK